MALNSLLCADVTLSNYSLTRASDVVQLREELHVGGTPGLQHRLLQCLPSDPRKHGTIQTINFKRGLHLVTRIFNSC